MSDGIDIRRVGPEEGVAAALAEVLIDCVTTGASVSFLLPLDRSRAETFWRNTLESVERGERIVFVAQERDSEALVGTVQVVLATPENQPHRAEIAKMLVMGRVRGRGVAEALMRAAEAAALAAGKTLLVLDTSSVVAERLYHRLGWQRVGMIPGYALAPDGNVLGTTIFYKELAERA